MQQPTEPAVTIVPASIDEEPTQRGRSGCTWGLAGAFGCLALLALPIVVAIILGATTLTSVVNSITGIFRPPTPVYIFNATSVVEKVQRLSQLTTVRYNYSGIVTVSTDMPGLLNALYGQQLVMIAVGHITAGVDLSKLTGEDVTINDGVIILRLPAPSLQDCFLNEQQTYVAERSSGAFASTTGINDLDAESRRYAVQQFREEALTGGILEEAQVSTQTALQDFIAALGFSGVRDVQVVIAPPPSEPALPDSCK